ncbi:CGNR zinc finger domain-containing protein [Kribbella sp. CA-293567]|uniref:CGNR zinc finger domain-containing protein n=1 Tax=Kribbella sp. CA-293567 TaxID=3002436 RepID=UPI0022DE74A5|nr:CGNR zinc finger domain-containing protein [Kribbella sp. CA-293567]WBQ07675.1 CGNR zinc finger domain-containing protein [Kribbella sp. CA-293567]
MNFDSHILAVLTAAVALVNRLTPGQSGGTPFDGPDDLTAATADALGDDGRPRPEVTTAQARQLAAVASRMRIVFEAAHRGETDRAAEEVNALLRDTHARPQLDRTGSPGWNLHFHGADDTLANGWAAGCAAGLAMALGSDLAGRLGVCSAPACDRVFVDASRNSAKRFCSPQCQSRVKAAAHRARRQTS